MEEHWTNVRLSFPSSRYVLLDALHTAFRSSHFHPVDLSRGPRGKIAAESPRSPYYRSNKKKHSVKERERMCVCVCMCEIERKRDRVEEEKRSSKRIGRLRGDIDAASAENKFHEGEWLNETLNETGRLGRVKLGRASQRNEKKKKKWKKIKRKRRESVYCVYVCVCTVYPL